MNGCLTGLAAITGGAATVEPWAAVLIGICAGWVYVGSSALLVRFRIDDAVDAIPVHMFGGAWGVIATGLFTSPQRLQDYLGRDTDVGWFYEWVSTAAFWSFAEYYSLTLTSFANDNHYMMPYYI